MNFLKKFALGLLYALLSPLLAAAIAIVAVFSLPNFLYQFIIMIINFFKGKTLFPPFEEDIEAASILQRAIDKKNGEGEEKESAPATPPVQNVYVSQTYYGVPPGAAMPGMMPPNPQQGQIPQGTYPNQGQIPQGSYPQQGLPPYQQPPYVQGPSPAEPVEMPTIDRRESTSDLQEISFSPEGGDEE